MDLFSAGVFGLLSLGLLVLKAWALVDCVVRPAPAFEAYGKLSKTVWTAILAVGALLALVVSPLNLFSLAGTVAAIVYLVDVRPAVRGSS